MPVANYNSSYITLRRQQATLYGYNSKLQTAQNKMTTVLREQPNTQYHYVITDRLQGGCLCDNSTA